MFPFGEGVYAGRGALIPEIAFCQSQCFYASSHCGWCVWGDFTFVAVLGVCSVEVVDGIDRMQLDLGEISVADPVELRSGLGGRGPRHVSLS